MRNLKRVLALVMALVMALSLMVMGVSAASYTDADQIDADYSEAFEVLTNIGVIKGQDNGNGIVAAPKAILTRAEASTLVYRLLTGDVTDAQKKNYDFSSFDDVKEGEWWTGYITYAANGGYVVGDGNGKFRPEDEVTGIQVLTIMLRAIGYGQNGEYVGAGWKDNVLTDAKELGIIGSISTKDLDKGASRELVAQLLFNAITTPKMVTYSALLGYRTDRDATTLGDKTFGLVKVTGVLTANEKADLYGTKTLAAGKSKLDDKTTYNLATDETLLGENITFWAYGLKGAKTAVTAPKSLATVTDWSNTNLSAAQVKKIAAATTDATEIFFNYDPAEKYISGKGIVVKAIDNDGDGKYEYILNVKETFATVQYISTTGDITLNAVDTGSNNQVAYDGIAVGNKVLVKIYDGNAWIEKADYVTGYISGYTLAAAGNTATIDGEKYEVSGIDYKVNGKATTQFTAVTDTYTQTFNGKTWNYYQDKFGNIIAYAEAGELETNYALILDYDYYKTGPWKGDMWVKYLTVDNEVETSIVDEDAASFWLEEVGPGCVVKYRLDADNEFVLVYDFEHTPGAHIATVPSLDLACVIGANGLNGEFSFDDDDESSFPGVLYSVDENLVAFYFVPAEETYFGEDYYGVLTGAEAIADLAVLAEDNNDLGKALRQMDATSSNYTHTGRYGTLKMVNIGDYINELVGFCYISSDKYYSSTTSTEGTLYFYNAIDAKGEPIVVTTHFTLDLDDAPVWAYYAYTIDGKTYNYLEDPEDLGFQVLYGDMHDLTGGTFAVYDKNSQAPSVLTAPEVYANAKGGTTTLDKNFCATGYAVAYRIQIDGVGVKLTTPAVFVTETVINMPTYVDVYVQLPGDNQPVAKHLPIGFVFDDKLLDAGEYAVTIKNAAGKDIVEPYIGKVTVNDDGDFVSSTIKVTKDWDGATVVITKYVPDPVNTITLDGAVMDYETGAQITLVLKSDNVAKQLDKKGFSDLKVVLYNANGNSVYSATLTSDDITINADGTATIAIKYAIAENAEYGVKLTGTYTSGTYGKIAINIDTGLLESSTPITDSEGGFPPKGGK